MGLEVAHINAASAGGPRAVPDASSEHALALCRNCHRTVDKNDKVYTEAKLRQMRDDFFDRTGNPPPVIATQRVEGACENEFFGGGQPVSRDRTVVGDQFAGTMLNRFC